MSGMLRPTFGQATGPAKVGTATTRCRGLGALRLPSPRRGLVSSQCQLARLRARGEGLAVRGSSLADWPGKCNAISHGCLKVESVVKRRHFGDRSPLSPSRMIVDRNHQAQNRNGARGVGFPLLTANWIRGALLVWILAFCFPVAADEKEHGFVPLFNGRDLTGWIEVQGKQGSFRVEDGVLIGDRHEKEKQRTAHWRSTNDKYGKFILRREYQLPPGGNSGVFIRVPNHNGRTSQMGMEIQLMYDVAAKNPPNATSTGSVYQVAAPKRRAQKPVGEWNEIEIICDGNRVAVA